MSSEKKCFKVVLMGDTNIASIFLHKYCLFKFTKDFNYKYITKYYEFLFSLTISSINDLKKEICDAGIFFADRKITTDADISKWINAFYEKYDATVPFAQCFINYHEPTKHFCIDTCTKEDVESFFDYLGYCIDRYKKLKNKIPDGLHVGTIENNITKQPDYSKLSPEGFAKIDTVITNEDNSNFRLIPKQTLSNNDKCIHHLVNAYAHCEIEECKQIILDVILKTIVHDSIKKLDISISKDESIRESYVELIDKLLKSKLVLE